MKVLITGINGFVGKHLAAKLCERQISCVGLSRQPLASDWWQTLTQLSGVNFNESQKASLQWIQISDLTDAPWDSLLSDVDVVIHLAARVHCMGHDTMQDDAFYKSGNVDVTKQLAFACKQSGVRQLIFASTIKVYGEKTDSTAITERTPQNPEDAYARSKCNAEDALESALADSKVHYTILRLPLVYGPGVGANFLRLLSLSKYKFPLPFAGIKNQRSLISVWNLVDIICQCSLNTKTYNQAFLVSDGDDFSTKDLVQLINPNLTLFWFPVFLLKWLAILTKKQSMADRLFNSLRVDN